MSRFKVSRYCLCGGEMVIESDDLRLISVMDQRFTEDHQGVGHVPCSQRLAARTRRRQLNARAEQHRVEEDEDRGYRQR